MALGLCKLCDRADFADPQLRELIRGVFGAQARRSPGFPDGQEYRKHWEVAMALAAFGHAGVLRPDAEVLGVGAGNEPTVFALTNHVRRVFATDLYLSEGWEESADAQMLRDPGVYATMPWNERRLVVQHMDGRDLRYEDESFDGIFSSSSLEHFGTLDDVSRALGEMHRVLRPGGVASLSTEFRLAGPAPGLPGVLMFDEEQLRGLLDGGPRWELVDELDLRPPAVAPVSFEEAASDVRAHVARHGAIFFDRLEWSSYPHVALREGDLVWTSVHLALRKPS